MTGRRPKSCRTAGTLLIGIASRRRLSSIGGVTSDLRTRPGTMLLNGLLPMLQHQ